MLDVDCEIAAGTWNNGIDWEALAARSVAAALNGAGQGQALNDPELRIEVAVRLSDDAEVQTLNRDYRYKDKPTNILSFPMQDLPPADRSWPQDMPELMLGDMVLAAETTAAEAAAKDISLEDHVAHLLVHGTLHLLGHDHQTDSEAEAMERLEIGILAGLGIRDPYADRIAEIQ